jgi:peptidoglycan lytic transglycosylase
MTPRLYSAPRRARWRASFIYGSMPPRLVRLVAAVCVFLSLGLAPTPRPAHRGRIHLVQTGLASFYGPGFNGDRTASGERFDQRRMVAAHRTLPLGTIARVTNLDNGRRLTVRIIDRGPYGRNHRKGCIIDLSKGAAARLGFVHDGIVHVRVRVLRLGIPDRVRTVVGTTGRR